MYIVTDQAVLNSITIKDVQFGGVLEGNSNGTVWVDNPEQPELVLIYSDHMEGFQVAGMVDSSFLEIVNDIMIPHVKSKGINGLEMGFENANAEEHLSKILYPYTIQRDEQYVYDLKHFQPITLSNDDSIRKIDQDLFDKIDNHQFVDLVQAKKSISECWPTLEKFFSIGIGYVKIVDRNIIGCTFSNSCYKNQQGIRIDTHKDFRRQGYGEQMARYFIKDALENGIIPVWDCWCKNIPSQKTAIKNGFVFNYKYNVYWIKL